MGAAEQRGGRRRDSFELNVSYGFRLSWEAAGAQALGSPCWEQGEQVAGGVSDRNRTSFGCFIMLE